MPRPTLAILLVVCGCVMRPAPSRPVAVPVAEIVWCDDLKDAAALWHAEAVRRFGADTIVLACHGCEFDNGEWECRPTDGRRQKVESVARAVAAANPTATVVLLVCNPRHREIAVAGGRVFYSRRNVTCVPGVPIPCADNSISQFRN